MFRSKMMMTTMTRKMKIDVPSSRFEIEITAIVLTTSTSPLTSQISSVLPNTLSSSPGFMGLETRISLSWHRLYTLQGPSMA